MTASWFLPGAFPERRPKPTRRRLAVFLAGMALAAGGAVVFVAPRNNVAPLQRPGPRRYPPAYRGQN